MAPRTGTFTVELEGRGPLTLRQSDYVATGGEGSVYRANNTIIKLYTDLAKMQRDGMHEKLQLLSKIRHAYIVAPQGLVLDGTKPIGYHMPFVEGEPHARVFTTSFRQREKFGDNEANKLVDRQREAVRVAHSFKAVLVDANELNWLTFLKSNNGPEPRAIDVDSWAIGRWPATVIMPSIRDWHAKAFNEASDWFAWGIVTFQIYTGIHPYKGRLDGYKPSDIEARMKANASVFTPGVGLNNAVRDFSCIPTPLREWYEATFQKGERTVPPSPFDKGVAHVATAARVHRTVTSATGSLVFDRLFADARDPVIRVFPCGVALLDSGLLYDLGSKRQIGKLEDSDGEVIAVTNGWVTARMNNGQPTFTFIDDRTLVETKLQSALHGLRIVRYENRLFIVTEQELVEMVLMQAGRPLIAVKQRTGILQPKATRWFDGVGIQEAFGAVFLVTPFGDASCMSVRTRELDGLVPVSAKAGNRFVAVVAVDKQGQYHKFEFSFSRDYSSYTLWRGTTDDPDLNVAILPKGVCATVVRDGELFIFIPTNGATKPVSDKQVTTTMSLSNWADTVVYIEQGAVWSVRIK